MIVALMLIAALADPDGVVATAPVDAGHVPQVDPPPVVAQDPAPHGLTTAQQIDRWLSAPPASSRAGDVPIWADEPTPRRIHGEVGAAIGTHGYRSLHGAVTVPIGDEGWISLFYEDTKSDLPRYYGDGRYEIYDRARRGPDFAPDEAW